MIIRPEQPGDAPAIFALNQAAFADRSFSSSTEGPIVDRLREDGDLLLSLVAVEDEAIIGHIAFSPVTVAGESEGLVGLGPVCCDPKRRGLGIGSALIHGGLARLPGAKGVFLVGDPNYYSRFGFVGDCGLTHGTVPPRAVQGLFLDGRPRRGEIVYAPAFRR